MTVFDLVANINVGAATLRIVAYSEIWSVIACACCYIGKRRFEAALAGFEHRDEVGVTWRSFELDPTAPHEREGDRAERLAEKYGMTVERAREMEQQMTDVADTEGLEFNGHVCAPQPGLPPARASNGNSRFPEARFNLGEYPASASPHAN